MKNFTTKTLRPLRNTKDFGFLSETMCPECLSGEFLERPI